ncbi:DUF4423 domain-containing protein [Bdellovibrio sp. BCCA]|uniref:DUF4423 domain-containing protein n=1 Tax=Bdellovibrio sp. BCCA TaxID=3136281 RepID=UPI0030F0689F
MLMNPVALMIRTLLTFKDYKKTKEQLADTLEVETEKITEALDILRTLGLIEECDGQFTSTHKNIKIPDNFSSMGLEQFYRKSFHQASLSINFPKPSRKHRSWFVALNEEDFNKYTKDTEARIREKTLEMDSDLFENKRLYQVLFAILPVSK